jgi:hypothetical protein
MTTNITIFLFIVNLNNFFMISWSDIVGELNLILKIIGPCTCGAKHVMTLPIKTSITSPPLSDSLYVVLVIMPVSTIITAIILYLSSSDEHCNIHEKNQFSNNEL